MMWRIEMATMVALLALAAGTARAQDPVREAAQASREAAEVRRRAEEELLRELRAPAESGEARDARGDEETMRVLREAAMPVTGTPAGDSATKPDASRGEGGDSAPPRPPEGRGEDAPAAREVVEAPKPEAAPPAEAVPQAVSPSSERGASVAPPVVTPPRPSVSQGPAVSSPPAVPSPPPAAETIALPGGELGGRVPGVAAESAGVPGGIQGIGVARVREESLAAIRDARNRLFSEQEDELLRQIRMTDLRARLAEARRKLAEAQGTIQAPAGPPPTTAGTAEIREGVGQEIRLMGVFGKGKDLRAEFFAAGYRRVAGVGQEVHGGWRVRRIASDEVVIEREGQTRSFRF